MKNTGIRTDIHPDTGSKPMKLEPYVERGPIDALSVTKGRSDIPVEEMAKIYSDRIRQVMEAHAKLTLERVIKAVPTTVPTLSKGYRLHITDRPQNTNSQEPA